MSDCIIQIRCDFIEVEINETPVFMFYLNKWKGIYLKHLI